MPQTIEAIQHARAGRADRRGRNKIDKATRDPDRVRTELPNMRSSPRMGGQNFRQGSARHRRGIDQLLEAILLQAEVLSCRRRARACLGVVISRAWKRDVARW